MNSNSIGLVKFLHPEMDRKFRDDDKYRCHATILGPWTGNELTDKSFTEDDFVSQIDALQGKKDFYFSVNSFYCAHRKTENVRHLNAIILDYDFYKLDQYKGLTAAEMFAVVKSSLPADPSFVVDSGRGLYVIFALEHCPYQITDLYRAVVNTLQKQQEQFGADPKATLVTQVIRIPGTVNSRSGKTVSIIESNCVRYPISVLAEKVLPFSRECVSAWKEKKTKYKTQKTLHTYKQMKFEKDLQLLIDHRNKAGIESGYREQLIYLYWESLLWSGKSEEKIITKVRAMNELFSHPLEDRQLLQQCKPARKYEFRTSKKKIISKLAITPEEMANLKFLVSADIQRKKLMRRNRRYMGKTNKEQALKHRRETIIRSLGQKKIEEIADLFGVSKKTILRDLRYIAEHLAQFQMVIREVMKLSVNNITEFVQQVIVLSCDVTWGGLPELNYRNGVFILF